MNTEKIKKLTEFEIYVAKRNNNFSLCHEKFFTSRLALSEIEIGKYSLASKTNSEAIHRFVTDDLENKSCSVCGKNVEFINRTKGWAKQCSRHCSAKHKVLSGVSTITQHGWKHTIATKLKMSKNHADFYGDKNPLRIKLKEDPTFSEKLSVAAVKKWAGYDAEKMEEISRIFSAGQAKSTKNKSEKRHRNHKSGFYKSEKMNCEMFYRSSWELKVCEFLEKDSRALYYKIEPFVIPYKVEESIRYTRIDFLVKTGTEKILIEVKPSSLINFGRNPYKIDGIKKYSIENNYRFEIITEKELNTLENLL